MSREVGGVVERSRSARRAIKARGQALVAHMNRGQIVPRRGGIERPAQPAVNVLARGARAWRFARCSTLKMRTVQVRVANPLHDREPPAFKQLARRLASREGVRPGRRRS